MNATPRRARAGAGAPSAVAAVALLAATTVSTEGCYTHRCDPLTVTLGLLGPDGGIVGTGDIVSRDPGSLTWESTPNLPADGGTWLLFPGMQTYVFMLPVDAGIPADARVVSYQAYESPDDASQTNNVLAAGYLTEFAGVGTDAGFSVFNATCATYFLRVIVTFANPSATASALDGGERCPRRRTRRAGGRLITPRRACAGPRRRSRRRRPPTCRRGVARRYGSRRGRPARA